MMDKANHKSPDIIELLDRKSLEIFGITRQEAQEKKICIDCKKPAIYFRDYESEYEYQLSAFCQDCQDNFFGVEYR